MCVVRMHGLVVVVVEVVVVVAVVVVVVVAVRTPIFRSHVCCSHVSVAPSGGWL